MRTFTPIFAATATAGLLLFGSYSAQAAPVDLPVYSSTYPTPNAACATFGNMVSCSTVVLDYLAQQNTPGFVSPYSFAASQGALLDSVVVTSNGGEILNNGDQITPSENGFDSNNGGQKKYFFTGDANDPANNGTLAGDTAFSWDISLAALNSKLTINNIYHQLMIAFDFNNPQSDTANLPLWTLITVRDTDGNLSNKYFETQALDRSGGASTIFKDPTLYQSNKTFDGTGVTTPAGADFANVVGSICVVNSVDSYPSPDGATCPNGGTLLNTNHASNAVEFINYLPGLDLLGFEGQGYDTVSVQVWMGCFNNGVTGSGPALLDNGSVGPCDTGGFGDIFLLAGVAQPTTNVPEPGSLLLMGLALGALGWNSRRRGEI